MQQSKAHSGGKYIAFGETVIHVLCIIVNTVETCCPFMILVFIEGIPIHLTNGLKGHALHYRAYTVVQASLL